MSSQLSPIELSIFEGDPLYQLGLRLKLIKQQAPRIIRRAVTFVLIAWLPLLILSTSQGMLVASVRIPFLYDPGVYCRFLLAVPLLIVAEIVVGPRITDAASQFITSGLVREENYPDFDAASTSALRLRNSTVAEVIVLVFTYIGAFEGLAIFSSNVSTWHSLVSESGHQLTLAGYWYALVSLPIFNFLVYRWLWRTFIWCRFLWRMSKLDLQLVPTHPDHACGLGFLGEAHKLFAIFIFAYAAAVAGIFGREIIFEKVPIETFRIPIAAFIIIALLLFLGPLLMFAPALLQTRRKALHEYSALGVKLGRLYHEKWIREINPVPESLLSVPDNTSLANYSRNFELVDQTRPFPFEPRTVLVLALAGLIPMVPLLATVMPMQEIFQILLKVLK